MHANVRGRVRNTPLSRTQGLLPLFESIINSIDSIEESGKGAADGVVTINIIRDTSQDVLGMTKEDLQYHAPIVGFRVTDNGIGFTDANFEAFDEADTAHKESNGGKGIGRFIWLRAFRRVHVDSIYCSDGISKQRTFDFSCDVVSGISNRQEIPLSGSPTERTIVHLDGFLDEFRKNVARTPDLIAKRIVEHCLPYFVLGRMPATTLIDHDGLTMPLDQVYERLVAGNRTETIELRGTQFDIMHFKLHADVDVKHHVCYCADRRVVQTVKLGTNKIPNLPPTISGDNGSEGFIYSGYVLSPALDQRVNALRTGFDTMGDEAIDPNDITWEEIERVVTNAIRRELESYTELVRTKKEARIVDFIAHNAPEYRYIAKNHPEYFDRIDPDVSNDKLELDLHEIGRELEVVINREGEELLSDTSPSTDLDLSRDELDRLTKWYSDYNEMGKSALAKYIAHRKLILTYFERALKMKDTGGYRREEIIHQIIFPLKKTSDDVTYDQHNLWLIDERLSYHEYLASDISLAKIKDLESDSRSRPDLVLFYNRAVAVTDSEAPFNSGVVIFEFKRPMRDDYDYDDDPFDQVLTYVQEIKAGLAKTKDGRPFDSTDATPFYCYIICDLTRGIKRLAEMRGLAPTPDNMGFIWYNAPLRAYVEVISFDKLLGDATKRNRILFSKLMHPSEIAGLEQIA